jgi:UDP-hydrolysing UDP-N-acetyl-D-glucosamine 2-epimerase
VIPTTMPPPDSRTLRAKRLGRVRRIAVVITARPSYSRVKTALLALRDAGADLQIIAAASALTWRHGRVVDVMRADGLDIAAEVPAVVDGGGTRESVVSTGLLTMQLGPVLASLRPDCCVTIADRHETLATAIAAAYQHIPLCHIQGGEVSGSIDDKVRNAVTQLADLHLVATSAAAQRVAAMRELCSEDWGWAQDGPVPIQITGCPSIDLAAEAVRLGPIHRADVIVLQHPVTGEVEQAGEQMRQTIKAVGPDALYFWPGEDAGADDMSKVLRLAGIHPVRNLEPVEFLRVLLGAKVLVGNSSVGIRECSFLGVSVVDVGSRQSGREHGPNWSWVRANTDTTSHLIAHSIGEQAKHGPYPSSTLYGDGHAGKRIAEALLAW